MENASKALLIAGEILIAMLILALGVALFTSYRGTAENYEEQMSAKEIGVFNSRFLRYIEYDSHERKFITAQDLITIINLAKNLEENEKIEVKIKRNDGTTDITESDILNPSATNAMYQGKEVEPDKTMVFPVYYIIDAPEWIQYDSIGRINSIKVNINSKYYKYNNIFTSF